MGPCLLTAALALLTGCSGNSQSEAVGNPTIDNAQVADQREQAFVKALLARMTLEEKVAQMIQAEIKHITPAEMAEYRLGSVLNGGGSHPGGNKHASIADWRALANDYYQAAISDPDKNAAVPLLWGTDAVHGHNNLFGAVVFPHNIGLGAANNPELTREIFAATARDVRLTGIKWAFSPTVAVARDDRWGRTYESFSEDPRIVASLSEQAVIGLQGADTKALSARDTVIATAKHFIGDGGTQNGIDQGDTQLTEAQLLDIHGQGFVAALEAKAQTVMASFNSWNGEKLHGHQHALTTLLKEKMNFDGFVIGDWNGHAQIPGCSKASCAQAINAGVDMLMAPEDWKALLQNTVAQVQNGEIAQSRIDDAVSRILRVKYRAGLFAAAQQSNLAALPDDEKLADILAENRSLARQAVRESLVLLKNNDNLLPLKANSRILLIGDAADNIAQQSGGWTLTWQGDGNSNSDFPNGSTLRQAFEQAVVARGGELTYDPNGALVHSEDFTERFDAVIYTFGELPYAEGAGDQAQVRLPNKAYRELQLLKRIAEQGMPVASVLISGRALSANAFINASTAFVAAWLPGSEATGVADVLIGNSDGTPRYDFSGKLAFSWPDASTQTPVNNYPEYNVKPQFPVGYGLDYQNSQTLASLPNNDMIEAESLVVKGTLPIFLKKINDPWSLYVGDEDNWSVNIDGNAGSTANNRTVVVSAADNATQEDARKVIWSEDRYGQFYFQNNQAIDITELANKDAALQFNVKVEAAPQSDVAMRMDCRYPCSGQIDVTGLLKSLPMNSWQSVAIDLDCFRAAGAELSQIDVPFLIGTSGPLALQLSHIVIDEDSTSTQRMECSGASIQANL